MNPTGQPQVSHGATPTDAAAAPAAARPPISSSLLTPGRQAVMSEVLAGRFERPLRLLEVGVWEAAGSTQFWLDHLAPGSELVLVDAWRPYASPADLDPTGAARSSWDYAAMDAQCDRAFQAACERLEAYERRHRHGPRVHVHLVRGAADRALAWMRDGSFDVVYIDGDHKYAQVRSDLAQACRLVDPADGLICGDDLERLPDAETLALARRHLDRDYLGAPHRFHPGVCLAVHERFGNVRMSGGFWWIHSRDHRFTTEVPTALTETPA